MISGQGILLIAMPHSRAKRQQSCAVPTGQRKKTTALGANASFENDTKRPTEAKRDVLRIAGILQKQKK
jgi:hypothetical protein